MVLNHKYRMPDQLKKLYRVDTIFGPIFFYKEIPNVVFVTQSPLLLLYWTDSIFWKTVRWKLGHKSHPHN